MSVRATSIYIIKEDGGDVIKIGIAGEPRARARSLQTGNSRQLSVAFQREFHAKPYARKVEYMSHQLLADKRREGEWFHTPLSDAISVIEASIVYVDQFLTRLAEIKITEMMMTRHTPEVSDGA